MSQQMRGLETGTKNIFLVAKTENIEQFTIEVSWNWLQPDDLQNAVFMEQRTINFFAFTKDVTAFQCEDCISAYWIWMRPYHTGNYSQIQRLNAYLDKNELEAELNYHIYAYQEVLSTVMLSKRPYRWMRLLLWI